jgi:hypothetical protein
MSNFTSPKDPAEKVVLTFDFTSELITGETLTGIPTVSFFVSQGVDASPGAMLNGAATIDATSKLVLQPVQAGLAGVDYVFKVSSTTSNAQKVLVRTGILKVRASELST